MQQQLDEQHGQVRNTQLGRDPAVGQFGDQRVIDRGEAAPLRLDRLEQVEQFVAAQPDQVGVEQLVDPVAQHPEPGRRRVHTGPSNTCSIMPDIDPANNPQPDQTPVSQRKIFDGSRSTCQNPPMAQPLPDPALIVLIGASGSGKSTWAQAHYRTAEIVSSDDLRGIVGSGRHDLDASADAFRLLDDIVTGRVRRNLATVIDTLGLEPARRQTYLALARTHKLPAIAVVFDTPAKLARERNAGRDRPVPAPVLAAQLAQASDIQAQLVAEGWDRIVTISVDSPENQTLATARPRIEMPEGLQFILQLSRFPWGDDPAQWLKGVAEAASAAGWHGIALMDHLIQIPQVDRAWAPIPEPWVTLGLLASLDTTLRLGPLVSPVTFRPPGITAKAAATLDVISGGRAFLGLGAGWWEREHAAFGLPFPSARERLDALEAAIETIRALWAPGTKADTRTCPRPPATRGRSQQFRSSSADPAGVPCRSPPGWPTAATSAPTRTPSNPESRRCAITARRPAAIPTSSRSPCSTCRSSGADRDEVWARVEQHRGRAAAATFARTHHAATYADQRERFARLADNGVSAVFVAPVHLQTADDVFAFVPMLS